MDIKMSSENLDINIYALNSLFNFKIVGLTVLHKLNGMVKRASLFDAKMAKWCPLDRYCVLQSTIIFHVAD